MKLLLSSESKQSSSGRVPALKVAALALAFVGTPLAGKAASLESLRAQDARLLRIAEPIMAGNVRLCDRTMPDLGVALQSTDQYPADGQPPFAAPVAFAAVLPGSAAAAAGIARDDGLLTIDGQPIAKRAGLESSPLRDSAYAALAEHPAGTPLVLGIVHAGERRDVSIPVRQECRAIVEILADNGNTARSDGNVVQIAFGLAVRASDDQLAAIFAHELSHSILHHRDRLSEADVKKGLLGEFGRNRRLNRQAETEADRLSVHLLANAGIDPRAAPALWRSHLGRSLSGGIFHDRAHPSAKARARALDEEIAGHLAAGAPSYPARLLANRARPMD
jgi:hypothetical protein